jgi:hypothetical protein
LDGILLTGEIPGQFEYEHLLSHTFPGFFTAVTFFMLMDVWSPSRLTEVVLSNYNNMIAFIGFVLLVGTIMGVILDNIHHSILESLIFDQFDEVQLWIKKFNILAKRYDDRLDNSEAENIAYYYFVNRLGTDSINYITHLRKAKYCYSEFYSNTCMCLAPS